MNWKFWKKPQEPNHERLGVLEQVLFEMEVQAYTEASDMYMRADLPPGFIHAVSMWIANIGFRRDAWGRIESYRKVKESLALHLPKPGKPTWADLAKSSCSRNAAAEKAQRETIRNYLAEQVKLYAQP